jgi:hypothetical protein
LGVGTGPSWGTHSVDQEEVPDGAQVLLGEHEPDVALDVGQDLLEGGVLVQVPADGLPHHGVLAHEHDGAAAHGQADLLHLLGAHIVGLHLKNEDTGVSAEIAQTTNITLNCQRGSVFALIMQEM